MKGILTQGSVLLVLLALAGCASSGVIEQASPISTSVPVSVDFALIQTSTALTGLATETHLLNALIVSNLRGSGVFGDVEDNPAAAGSSSGIKVEIKIMEIKKISHDEREWAGALAGRARISVRATVSDLSSGRLIETFEAEGQSSGGSDLAGTTNEAVQRAAEQVVAELVRISRQTAP